VKEITGHIHNYKHRKSFNLQDFLKENLINEPPLGKKQIDKAVEFDRKARQIEKDAFNWQNRIRTDPRTISKAVKAEYKNFLLDG